MRSLSKRYSEFFVFGSPNCVRKLHFLSPWRCVPWNLKNGYSFVSRMSAMVFTLRIPSRFLFVTSYLDVCAHFPAYWQSPLKSEQDIGRTVFFLVVSECQSYIVRAHWISIARYRERSPTLPAAANLHLLMWRPWIRTFIIETLLAQLQ